MMISKYKYWTVKWIAVDGNRNSDGSEFEATARLHAQRLANMVNTYRVVVLIHPDGMFEQIRPAKLVD